jgi:hypothetical protein
MVLEEGDFKGPCVNLRHNYRFTLLLFASTANEIIVKGHHAGEYEQNLT